MSRRRGSKATPVDISEPITKFPPKLATPTVSTDPYSVSLDSVLDSTNFFFKPHTITVMIGGVLVILYMAFFLEAADHVVAIKRGLATSCFIFLVYCVLQLRDGLLVHPHPAFWRIVTGIGILYLMLCTFILQLEASEARAAVRSIFPDAGVQSVERSYGDACAIWTPEYGFKNVWAALGDEFIIAHLLGWWGSAILFRDARLCFVLSIAFELLEISLQHVLKNFKECWWDHIILDLLVCNVIGIYSGLWTCRLFEMREYNWMGFQKIPTTKGKIARLLNMFTPFSWTKYKWEMFSSFSRLVLIVFSLLMYLIIKVNSFFVKSALFIPPRSVFNTLRLILMWVTALPACREFYEYVSNPQCTKVGPHTWLTVAMTIMECLVSAKFIRGAVAMDAWPANVILAWLIFAVMFAVWAALYFPLKYYVGHLQPKPAWWVPTRKALDAWRYLSFVPLAIMFVAECPDLQWFHGIGDALKFW
eukprot:TRINITY_DN5833_c0_g1_i1.p1 TRINITY_DN5833_c0_g1~~TRINITY_DN5833_c0_g1_i1.p1  ORF type:complete len:476 (-),score=93.31 TRINITY_DN5833_c0_g1_i1:905-2332(-)